MICITQHYTTRLLAAIKTKFTKNPATEASVQFLLANEDEESDLRSYSSDNDDDNMDDDTIPVHEME
jgi:hypothetical protein